MLRWAWRQLTSMRTALMLLLLLAIAAVPGSVVPQEAINASALANWQDAHPKLTPIYDKIGLFHVYSSVWFGAVYVLLMISLVGCILPRCAVYWRALKLPPRPLPSTFLGCPNTQSSPSRPAPMKCWRGRRRRSRAWAVGRARLPARGGQPGLPPLHLDRAGRLRIRIALWV